jgi:hypothetical protein
VPTSPAQVLSFFFPYRRPPQILNSFGLPSRNFEYLQILLFVKMVITNGHSTNVSYHRPNRRRERPGSRARRTLTLSRKANSHFDCAEGLHDALDTSVALPSDKPCPSPLLRQNFDQSWQRWKARQVEEREEDKALQEQLRLFGGDLDEDVSAIPDATMLDVVLRLFGDIDYVDP